MAGNENVPYKDLKSKTEELGVTLPFSTNLKGLFEELKVGSRVFANRFAVQPMEGCDCEADGTPTDLTKRRYHRFATGGAGLIWFEANAVCQKGRANPRQMMLTEQNKDSFKRMVEDTRETAQKEGGVDVKLILQATHSGRYSKPNGVPEPIIAYNNPLFEKDKPLDASCIITDDELKALEENYTVTAKLAEEVGFDGVDIKACHRYLVSELLSAYERKGQYGGDFDNRTRFLRNCYAGVKSAVSKDFIVTSRMNVYDGFPYPYGFGVSPEGGLKPYLQEAKDLIEILKNDYGLQLLNVTIGNPYVNPHVNRPYDKGPYVPDESPLVGVERMMNCVGEIQKAVPDVAIIGSGFSYLKDYGAYLAAGAIEEGVCSIAGFGRQSFAYPEFVKELRDNGKMDKSKCCLACGKCTEMMRMGQVAGCVIKNKDYLELYRKAKETCKPIGI